MTAPTTAGRTLTGLVWFIAAGVLLQAVLAGQFISGLTDLRGVHAAVGSLLELAGLILVVVAAVDGRTRRQRRGQWLAALLLGVAVVVQALLGHAPGPAPTSVHVPLGVTLFAWSAVLSIVLARPVGREVTGPAPTSEPTATQAGSR